MRLRAVYLLIAVLLLNGCGNSGWRKVETDHLILHYKPGSFAERALDQAMAEYEDSYRAATRLLPQVEMEGKIKVYLHEGLDRMGFTRAAAREVHFRYDTEFRLTSMHEFLHVFLYRFNRHAPLRFEEGVCRMNEVRSVRVGGGVRPVPLIQLGKRAHPDRWRVEEVFLDEYETDNEGNLAAAFAAFALEEQGAERFWEMYRRLRKNQWRAPLEEYFGYGLPEIESRFVTFMNRLPDPPGRNSSL